MARVGGVGHRNLSKNKYLCASYQEFDEKASHIETKHEDRNEYMSDIWLKKK